MDRNPQSAILATSSAPACGMQIYMPRTIKVDCDQMKLGQVVLIRFEDAKLATQAAEVTMGRGPFAGEELAIDRNTILCRLGASGIRTDAIKFAGSTTTTVTRTQKVIEAAQLTKAAEECIQAEHPAPAGAKWRASGTVRDMVLQVAGPVKLQAQLVGKPSDQAAKVLVAAGADGAEARRVELALCMEYTCKQTVALKDIAVGEMLTPQNVKVDVIAASSPREWANPFGMVAVRAIKSGNILANNVFGAAKGAPAALIVKRGQTVVMKIEGAGFIVSAIGAAQEDGHAGDSIKVRNVDSNRIITAKVNDDGTVAPVINEVSK
jgi:flagella basal body P-ring formation protein FlgA